MSQYLKLVCDVNDIANVYYYHITVNLVIFADLFFLCYSSSCILKIREKNSTNFINYYKYRGRTSMSY